MILLPLQVRNLLRVEAMKFRLTHSHPRFEIVFDVNAGVYFACWSIFCFVPQL